MKLLLKNAVLWDGPGGWRSGAVWVKDDRIAEAGAFSEAEADRVMDLTGFTLLPGFVDAHIHIALDDDPFGEDALVSWAKNGVAAVRDCAMLSALAVPDFMAWQEAEDSPRWPLVVNTGKYIDVPGGYGSELPPGHQIGLLAETEEEAARAVDYLWENGCTQLKIALDDSPSPFSPEPRQHNLTPDLIHAICKQAKERGMKVTAHVLAAKHLKTLVSCGISDAGHTPTDPIPDELLREMAEKGIPMVSTAVGPVEDNSPEALARRKGPPPPPPEMAEAMAARKAALTGQALDNLKRFSDLGGKILLGTDLMFSGNYPMCACIPVLEMAGLKRVGVSTEEILKAGTCYPAEAIGLGRELGTLEPGKLACLVAFRGNLDEGFERLLQPELVINRGEILTERM